MDTNEHEFFWCGLCVWVVGLGRHGLKNFGLEDDPSPFEFGVFEVEDHTNFEAGNFERKFV